VAGAIHLGSNRADGGLHGTIMLDRRDRDHRGSGYRSAGRHHGSRRIYGSAYGGFYNRDYSPIYGYGLGYRYPYYGYSYSSLYYPSSYIYRFADRDIYYADQIVETQVVYQGPPAAQAVAPSSTTVAPVEQETYQSLIEPGESTLIGQGNQAYLAGRYDDARRSYATAMLADERDGYVKFLYALANFALQDYEVGGMAIRRALLTTPELIEYPVDIRGLYRDPAIMGQQIARLVRFVDTHPTNNGAQLLLGYVLFAAGKPEQAMVTMEILSASNMDDNLAALLRDAIVRVSREKKPE
jgi:hypothetical protein